MISKYEWHDYAGYLHHWLHMKTYIINSSEVSGLSVEIHPVILHSLTFSDVLSL